MDTWVLHFRPRLDEVKVGRCCDSSGGWDPRLKISGRSIKSRHWSWMETIDLGVHTIPFTPLDGDISRILFFTDKNTSYLSLFLSWDTKLFSPIKLYSRFSQNRNQCWVLSQSSYLLKTQEFWRSILYTLDCQTIALEMTPMYNCIPLGSSVWSGQMFGSGSLTSTNFYFKWWIKSSRIGTWCPQGQKRDQIFIRRV